MTILPLVVSGATWQPGGMTERNETASRPHAPRTVRPDEQTPEEETQSARRATAVAWGCLLIVYVVWGSTYLAIRVGVETMPPLLMAATRNLAAGLILFPVALRARRGGRGPASRRRSASGVAAPLRRPAASRPAAGRAARWLGCAVVGVLLLVANAVVGIGEQTVPSGLAALLVATVPLWLIGIDAVLNHARIGLAPAAGLALGLAGVALLSGLGGGSAPISAGGVVIILAAAAMWAAGTIMARRVTLPRSAALASGMQLLCGGITLLVLAAATGELGSLRLARCPRGPGWRSAT